MKPLISKKTPTVKTQVLNDRTHGDGRGWLTTVHFSVRSHDAQSDNEEVLHTAQALLLFLGHRSQRSTVAPQFPLYHLPIPIKHDVGVQHPLFINSVEQSNPPGSTCNQQSLGKRRFLKTQVFMTGLMVFKDKQNAVSAKASFSPTISGRKNSFAQRKFIVLYKI
ncbi:hypothetical protein CEXT_173051 [Caerostris extrusa]|uniref:Uncharacterized protein n=1 Tax=Caerostris extrusa TaxID=172846 RepID=A0AAV4P7M1_CAEEX|nr:hypothetical protein CEXT_173051 [Caerostris extrusa]